MTTVIFDLDGTLIDSAPDLHAACIKMLADAGRAPIPYEQTVSFIGNGVDKLVERVMGAADMTVSADSHAENLAVFTEHYNAAPVDLTVLYPGVMEALDRLEAAGCVLGLCTNKPEAPARMILEAFDLAGRMQVVVGGDTLRVKKPDPAPLFHAFAALPDGPRLYVGDSEVDAETAQVAGISFALFSGGYRKTPVTEIPHDSLFDHHDDLPAIAARLA